MTTPATRSAPAEQTDGGFTHRQILTILVGLMMGMFLAALDQTIVAHRDPHHRRRPARLLAAGLGDHGVPDHVDDLHAALRQAVRHLRPQAVLPRSRSRSSSSARRCAGCPDVDVRAGRRSGPSRASAPAACSRWRWRSSATSCRRGSGPSTRATSSPSSAPRACSARSSAASSPGQRSILGITGWRWVFLRQRADRHRRAGRRRHRCCTCRTPARDHRIDWPGAVALIVGLVPLLIVAEQGRDWGWGSGRALRLLRASAWSASSLFILAERAYGDDALLPLRLFRNRTFSRRLSLPASSSAWACSAASRCCRSTCRSSRAPRRPRPACCCCRWSLGIMAGSIISGQIISRTGRYRIFPIIGAALMVVALLLFSLDRRRHPAVADHAGHGRLRPRPRRQHAADDRWPCRTRCSPREIGVATRRRRSSARWAARSAPRCSCRCCSPRLPGKIADAFSAAQAHAGVPARRWPPPGPGRRPAVRRRRAAADAERHVVPRPARRRSSRTRSRSGSRTR